MSVQEDIPREPEAYYPSEHCVIRHKERGIEWDKVAETIETGRLNGSHKEDCEMFLKEFEDLDLPIGVVANYKTGEILTIERRE